MADNALIRLGYWMHAARLYRDLLTAAQLSPSALAQLRRRRLAATVRHAYATVPYYRHLFDRAGMKPGDVRSEEDLAGLPITSKEVLRQLPREEIVSSAVPLERFRGYTTSGSTGVPFTHYKTMDDRLRHLMTVYRVMVLLGLRWTDRLVSIGEIFYARGTPVQRLGLLQTEVLHPLEPFERQIELLRAFRPTVLVIHPSAARALGLALLERNIILPPVRLVFTTSELLDRPTADLIGHVFGTAPRSVYGMSEVGRLGWQCRPGGLHHLSDDFVIAEVVQGEKRVPDGETGELVITNLIYRDMPYIRYRTGDLVRKVPRACTCTHSFGQIELIGGRVSELLVMPDGTVRPPLFITSHIHQIPGIVQYQLRQEHVETVTIQVVTGVGYDEGAGDRLRREVEAILPGVRVVIERVLEIPRTPGGKHRYVAVSPEVRARIPTPPPLS